jgi:hypothetical protein
MCDASPRPDALEVLADALLALAAEELQAEGAPDQAVEAEGVQP